MALSLFVAQAVLEDYLNGRSLPETLRDALVHSVESRFIDGTTPVLDRALCESIDDAVDTSRTNAELSNS
jgi:hypothetical protein